MIEHTEKTTITKSEYLQLLGLKMLADESSRHQQELLKSASKITGEEHDRGGHTSDLIYDQNTSVNHALKMLGITVVDSPSPEQSAGRGDKD